MPFSSSVFDTHIEEVFRLLNPRTLLDIGSGSGKYGEMMRRAVPTCHTAAIELEAEYIETYRLRSIYDEVWCMSALDLVTPKYYEHAFGTAVIGDTIEHLRKSEGVDLLNFLVYHTEWIIVQFPHQFPQNTWNGFTAEAHISVWSEHDFAGFDATKMYSRDTQRLIVIKGYCGNRITLNDVEAAIQNQAPQTLFP